MKRTIGTLTLCVLFWLMISGCTGKADAPDMNGPAPLFTLEDIHGGTVKLEDLRGKVVLLNFFATWCGPCRQEVPEFIRVYEKLKDKGFEIIAVGLDAGGEQVLRAFARDHRIPYPILPGTRNLVLDYGGIGSIPTTFLIDHEGRVVDRFIGWRPAARLEQSIGALLRQKV